MILPWSSRAADQGKSLLRFLRNIHIGFHRGWVSLHSSMASLEFVFSLPIWWGNLNMVLIWTPLMPTDVEYLSNDYWPSALHLLRALCSLHYHIYWSFDVFVSQFFSPLHILDINPLSDAELAKICSYLSVFIVSLLDSILLCGPGWPQTCNDPPVSAARDYKCSPPHLTWLTVSLKVQNLWFHKVPFVMCWPHVLITEALLRNYMCVCVFSLPFLVAVPEFHI